jgi:hypothetical protein
MLYVSAEARCAAPRRRIAAPCLFIRSNEGASFLQRGSDREGTECVHREGMGGAPDDDRFRIVDQAVPVVHCGWLITVKAHVLGLPIRMPDSIVPSWCPEERLRLCR